MARPVGCRHDQANWFRLRSPSSTGEASLGSSPAAGLAGAALALRSLEFGARFLAPAHERLVPLLIPKHTAAFDGLLEATHKRLKWFAWSCRSLHSLSTAFRRAVASPQDQIFPHSVAVLASAWGRATGPCSRLPDGRGPELPTFGSRRGCRSDRQRRNRQLRCDADLPNAWNPAPDRVPHR